MNRGRRHEDIFHFSEDYHSFIAILQETAAAFALRVSAYCLMPNHYHLLVQTPAGNISRCMRHINGVYTQRYNRLHETDGQVFRGRYKSVLVEDDQYLLEVMKYIHTNPVSAGLVENIGDYNWSSYWAYLSRAKKWQWITLEPLYNMLSATKADRKSQYLEFMGEKLSEDVDSFYSMKKFASILGSRLFCDEIKKKFRSRVFEKEITEARQLVFDQHVITGIVCAYFSLDESQLLKGRRGVVNRPRDICMYLFKHYRRDSLTEIGEYFGVKSYSTVSSAVQRVKNGLGDIKSLRRDIGAIEKKLYKGQS